jgi:integrase
MIERDGINSTVEVTQSIDSTTFSQQAELWIKAIEDGRVFHCGKRTRIKPASVAGYKSAIEWMTPHIGKMPLANIKNAAAKELVTTMKQAELFDKTIVNYVHLLQSVIASVVNGEGEQVHLRTWDPHFIGLPVVNPKKQNRPTRTAKEIEKILAAVTGWHRVLYALLAGSGLRIGEAVAIRLGSMSDDYSTISEDCSTIYIRQAVWRGKEQDPKTQAGVRGVDLPKELAALLSEFVGDRKEGFLFRSASGKPLSPRNILRDSLHPALLALKQPRAGFHCFRRFRESMLQMSDARNLLIDYWMGHENREMGTRYAKQLIENIEWRKEWAEKVGLGFKLPSLPLGIGQLGQPSEAKTQSAKAA